MRDLKEYAKYIITILLFTILIMGGVFSVIIIKPRRVFYSTYQNLISDKYRILEETNVPKIIMVSGSSSAFGLDQPMLEEETGYAVANLGLHGGFGHLFYSELAKENINEGDIVLLGYEYGWETDLGFNTLGQDLIMSGIDDNIDMYKHIPLSRWKEFIGYLFKYAEKKYEMQFEEVHGIYSREAFDDTGQMTMHREYEMDYENNVKTYGTVNLTNVDLSDSSIKYLTTYRKYIESRGARVYFVSPPVLKKAINCDYKWFDILKQKEEDTIGIAYISNPSDYFFDDELMSNAIYHCSTLGEKERTRLLAEDLKRAGVIE